MNIDYMMSVPVGSEARSAAELMNVAPSTMFLRQLLAQLNVPRHASVTLSTELVPMADRVVLLDTDGGMVRFRPPTEGAEAWWSGWALAVPGLAGVTMEEAEPPQMVTGSDQEFDAEIELITAIQTNIGTNVTIEFDEEDGNWPVNVRIGAAEFRADTPSALRILRAMAGLVTTWKTA